MSTIRFELSPEQATALANKLLSAAQRVGEAPTPDAYMYVNTPANAAGGNADLIEADVRVVIRRGN